MKPLLDTALFLVWVTAYLGLAYAVCRYRQSRAGAGAGAATGRTEYRADKDWGVRLGVFLVGAALAGIGYLFTRFLNH